jgi:hypothetical protein
MTQMPSNIVRVAALAAVLLLGACAPGGGAAWTYAPLGPSPTPVVASPTPQGSAPPAANQIDLELTADLHIVQNGAPVSEIHVTDGETYQFKVDNTAGFSHDFYLGPPDRLSANDTAGLPGIATWETGVKSFIWTATHDADGWQFACTVPGHYTTMHGNLVVDSAGS